MADVSSLNSRAHALRPVTDFSARIRSSGSVSRWGRYRRAEREVVAAERELVGSASSALDVLVGELGPLELEEQEVVADRGRPLVDVGEQLAALGVGRVDGEPQTGVGADLADDLRHRRDLVHDRRELRRVELGELPPVHLQRGDALRGVVEHRVDAVGAETVDQWFEVPGDVGSGEVVRGRRHAREPTARWASTRPSGASASGRAPACTTSRRWVARVSVT